MAAGGPVCHVENADKIKTAMAPSQMCQCFEDQLSQDIGSQADLSEIRVVLKMDSAHYVEATITRESDQNSIVLPPMAVEVLDRPLNLTDIRSLATSIGHALLNQKS